MQEKKSKNLTHLHCEHVPYTHIPSKKEKSKLDRIRLCVICIALSLSYSQAIAVSEEALNRAINTSNHQKVAFNVEFLRKIIRSQLPIKPKIMTIGKVTLINKKTPGLIRPIFVVGSDEKSIMWINKHKEQLIKINAVGLIIEVKDIESLRNLSTIASPLPISIGKEELILNAVNVKHYPFLLHTHGIEQ